MFRNIINNLFSIFKIKKALIIIKKIKNNFFKWDSSKGIEVRTISSLQFFWESLISIVGHSSNFEWNANWSGNQRCKQSSWDFSFKSIIK
jgi:hypothetical protein